MHRYQTLEMGWNTCGALPLGHFGIAIKISKNTYLFKVLTLILYYNIISKVWSEFTTEMDFTVVSFTLAVNNHCCKLLQLVTQSLKGNKKQFELARSSRYRGKFQ